MVGSRDYWNPEIDGNVNVALRPRLPGSSFKPIVYAKPPSVVTLPDVIEPISYGEYWRRVELAWWLGRSWWVL